jgi:hypothetical protein
MPGMKLQMFGGAVPIASRRLVPDNMAEVAVNTDLLSGEIRPFRQPRIVQTFSGGSWNRAFRFTNGQWIPLSSIHARVFRSPLVNDAFERFIKLDGNAPGTPVRALQNSRQRIANGDPWLKLGMPVPVPLSVSHSGGVGSAATRAYTYTFVNMFGEESQPADPVTATGKVDGTWAVTGMAAPVNASDYGITHFRIYRTVVGSNGTEYYRVVEQAIATTSYNDTLSDVVIAFPSMTLQSTFWREPEDMEGIIQMPNGFFAAWSGRDVFFSEPYRPWAWPAEYILTMPDPVVGCGVTGSSLVVLTNSRPVVITGSRPSNMSMERSDFIEPCLSPESVFSALEGVYFAGTDGLMLANQGGVFSVTRSLIDPNQWRRDYAASLISVVVTNKQVFGFQESGYGFVLDKDEQRAGIVRLRNMPNFTTVWRDFYSGTIYGMFDGAVYELFGRFDAPAACGWRSKEFMLPRPVSMGALMISIDSAFDADSVGDIESNAPPIAGGPWTDQSALYGYMQYGECFYAEAPDPGTLPPGGVPPAAGWPNWYGLVPDDIAIDDLSGLGLPSNIDTYVIVYAGRVPVWRAPVSNGIIYRLPSGFKDVLWQFDIITRVPVFSLQVAETPKEIADV